MDTSVLLAQGVSAVPGVLFPLNVLVVTLKHINRYISLSN